MRAQATVSSGGTLSDIDNRAGDATEDTTAVAVYAAGTTATLLQMTIGSANFTAGEGIVTWIAGGSNGTYIQLSAEI